MCLKCKFEPHLSIQYLIMPHPRIEMVYIGLLFSEAACAIGRLCRLMNMQKMNQMVITLLGYGVL